MGLQIREAPCFAVQNTATRRRWVAWSGDHATTRTASRRDAATCNQTRLTHLRAQWARVPSLMVTPM